MARHQDDADDDGGLAPHAEWTRSALKRCDPPAGAQRLTQLVLDDASEELSALWPAFSALKAEGSARAGDAFAAAVYRFHEQARRRLITGEVIAFGRLPGAWGEYVRIPPAAWHNLIWGSAGELDGVAGIARAQSWRPSPPDSWKVSWVDHLGSIQLPGGADLPTEVAYAWMTSLWLDEVTVGACSYPFAGSGWRVLGLTFPDPPQRLCECVFVAAADISAKDACAAWLRSEVAAGPQLQTKSWYFEQARTRWVGLSERAFKQAWKEATRGATDWGKSGRRPKKKS